MKNRTMWIGAVAVCVLSFSLGRVGAQEKEAPAGPPVAEWTKLTKEHEFLGKQVGTWDVAGRYWMAPGADPMVAKGVAEQQLVLGGRFLQQKFTLGMGGMSMEGLGYWGWDTVTDQWVMTWMDDHGPYLYIYRGTTEADGTHRMRGKEPHRVTGKPLIDAEFTMKWKNDDAFDMTVYMPDADGRKQRVAIMNYVRRKK